MEYRFNEIEKKYSGDFNKYAAWSKMQETLLTNELNY